MGEAKWIAATALTAAAVVIATGCHRGPLPQYNGLSRRDHRRLIRRAARDMRCRARQIRARSLLTEPQVWTVEGCNVSAEYVQACRGRRCRWEPIPPLVPTLSAMLSCPPHALTQLPPPSPGVLHFQGCGRAATLSLTCMDARCGWQPWSADGTAWVGGAAPTGPVPPPPGAAPVPPPPGVTSAAASDGPSTVAARLEQMREALRSCLGSDGALTLTIRWADGQVQTDLPTQFAGSVVGSCVEATIATLNVTGIAPGELSLSLP